jgi:hypothetical protein
MDGRSLQPGRDRRPPQIQARNPQHITNEMLRGEPLSLREPPPDADFIHVLQQGPGLFLALGNKICPELQLNEVPHNPSHQVRFFIHPASRPCQLKVEIAQYAVACALLVRTVVFGDEPIDDSTALADFGLESRGTVILRKLADCRHVIRNLHLPARHDFGAYHGLSYCHSSRSIRL